MNLLLGFFRVQFTYSNRLEARLASLLLYSSMAFFLAAGIYSVISVIPWIIENNTIDLLTLVVPLVAIASIGVYILIQGGQLTAARALFIGSITLAALSILFQWPRELPNLGDIDNVVLLIPVIASGLILGRRGLLTVTLITIIALLLAALGQTTNTAQIITVPANEALYQLMVLLIVVVVLAGMLLAFASGIERIASEALRINQRRDWIHRLNQGLQDIEGNERDVLKAALNRINSEMPGIQTEIYLMDEAGNLFRGIAAVNMQRDRVLLSDGSHISEAVRNRAGYLVTRNDVTDLRRYLNQASSEGVALPLLEGQQILGVIDFQKADAFERDQMETLALLAEQVALSYRQSRDRNRMTQQLREQNVTLDNLREQLATFVKQEQQRTVGVWQQYVQGRGRKIIGFDMEAGSAQPVPSVWVPGGVAEAVRTGAMQTEQRDGEQVVSIPIRFRDQSLGAMSFTLPSERPVSQQQLEVAKVVSERLALALENSRLFEQSQAQAHRERRVNDINALLIGSTDVQAVLNLAAENFNEALGAINTRIYIQPQALEEPRAQQEADR